MRCNPPAPYVRGMTAIDSTTTRSIAPSQVDPQRALATLTVAFTTDPVIRWLFSDDRTFEAAFPRLAGLMGGDAFAADTAWVAAVRRRRAVGRSRRAQRRRGLRRALHHVRRR